MIYEIILNCFYTKNQNTSKKLSAKLDKILDVKKLIGKSWFIFKILF